MKKFIFGVIILACLWSSIFLSFKLFATPAMPWEVVFYPLWVGLALLMLGWIAHLILHKKKVNKQIAQWEYIDELERNIHNEHYH